MKTKPDFYSYQWVAALSLYWGLRILGQHHVASGIGRCLEFIFVMGIGCVLICIVGDDKKFLLVSKRATKEISISLVLVLVSEIIWALSSLVRFDKLDSKYILLTTITQYGLWIVFPVVFLLTEKKWIINTKGR